MRVILASSRGLLGGWLMAMTMPLMINPRAVADWSATGLHDELRVGLAAIEVLGAALFAFDGTALAGLLLLLISFIAAAVIHLRLGDRPWWLAGYAIAGILLLYFTHRVRRQNIK
jgi:hypothetical protein